MNKSNKKTFFLFLLIAAFIVYAFSSCNNNTVTVDKDDYNRLVSNDTLDKYPINLGRFRTDRRSTYSRTELSVIVIDSCEYIGNLYGGNGDLLTHKGNCKFCAQRKINSK